MVFYFDQCWLISSVSCFMCKIYFVDYTVLLVDWKFFESNINSNWRYSSHSLHSAQKFIHSTNDIERIDESMRCYDLRILWLIPMWTNLCILLTHLCLRLPFGPPITTKLIPFKYFMISPTLKHWNNSSFLKLESLNAFKLLSIQL